MSTPPTGTVTFLFTDIEGSTTLAQQHPHTWASAQSRHHALLHEAMAQHQGHVFNLVGDAFCVAFHTASDALAAALTAQRALQRMKDEGGRMNNATADDSSFISHPSSFELRVRMGLHTGEAEFRDGDYHGYLTLVRVQRIMSAAYGGQVLLSHTTAALVRGQLPEGTSLREMGQHRFKGLLEPEQVLQLVAPDLPSDFPPLKTLNAIPNNLPIQPTSFIGREHECAEVKRLLTGKDLTGFQNLSGLPTRLLTLTGSGGAGKTRLSLQVGANLCVRPTEADTQISPYPDGVWFIELAPLTDPSLVPQVIADVFSLRAEAQRPLLDTLLDYLRGKALLLILDNCEHLIEACAQFATTALCTCPQLKIMASSREALGIAGETTYSVPSLAVPPNFRSLADFGSLEQLTQYDAVKLFIARALAAQPSFSVTNANAPAVAQICHRLDGIPLAIELAAARVKSLSVEQIAKRLDDRFRLLTGGSRTALPRQQTLRALIDWSYGLLSESERILLRRLSVFVGGWTLEAAEQVTGDGEQGTGIESLSPVPRPLSPDDVLDVLAQLVNKSLVVFEEREGESRYRMLETVRQYAREKLLESDEGERVRNSHLDFFMTLAEQAEPQLHGPDQFEWAERLDVEHDNLRAALEWSLGAGRVEKGMRLAGALTWFWDMRAYFAEGRLHTERLLESDEVPSDALLRAKVLFADARLARRLDEGEVWRAHSERMVTIARMHRDAGKSLLAIGLDQLAATEWRDHPTRAETLLDEAWAAALSAGDPFVQGWVLAERGARRHYQQDFDGAGHLYADALQQFRSMGDRRFEALVLTNLGRVHFTQHHYGEAQKYLEQSLATFRAGKDRRSIVSAGNLLGELARLQGEYVRARQYYVEALAFARELGPRGLTTVLLNNLAFTLLHLGEHTQSHAMFKEALMLEKELGDKDAAIVAIWGLAAHSVARGAGRQPQRAAQLMGAVDGLLRSPTNFNSADQAEWEHTLVALRASLDEATLQREMEQGRTLTFEQAMTLALEEK